MIAPPPVAVRPEAFRPVPSVSVVVAVRNAAATLVRCLDSIGGQDWPDRETIVMDGGSTDGSREILDRHRPWIDHLESAPDRGVYHAWNKALERTRGEWVCFLGADDRFAHGSVLSEMAPHLRRAQRLGVRVVYGRAAKVDGRGRVVRRSGAPWRRLRWQMGHGMPLIHSGIFHHRSLFAVHGRFDERFRIAGDYEMLLRELGAGRALFAPGVSTVIHAAGGLSDRNNLRTHLEIARARRRHGHGMLSPVWSVVFLRAVLRTAWRRIRSGAGGI